MTHDEIAFIFSYIQFIVWEIHCIGGLRQVRSPVVFLLRGGCKTLRNYSFSKIKPKKNKNKKTTRLNVVLEIKHQKLSSHSPWMEQLCNLFNNYDEHGGKYWNPQTHIVWMPSRPICLQSLWSSKDHHREITRSLWFHSPAFIQSESLMVWLSNILNYCMTISQYYKKRSKIFIVNLCYQ